MKKLFSFLILIIFFCSVPFSERLLDLYNAPKEFIFIIYSSIVGLLIGTYYFITKDKRTFSFNLLDLLILAYFAYKLLNYIWFKGLQDVEQTFFVQVYYLIFYFFVKKFLLDKDYIKLRLIFYFLLILPSIQLILVISQKAGIMENQMDFFEIGGSFGNPGVLSIYVVSFLPISLGFLIDKDTSKTARIFLLLISIGIISIIIISFSRTAWIVSLVVILFILNSRYSLWHKLLSFRSNRYLSYSLIFIILVILILLGIFLYKIKPASTNGRLFIWELTLNSIKESPIVGKGLNSFRVNQNIQQADYFKLNDKADACR